MTDAFKIIGMCGTLLLFAVVIVVVVLFLLVGMPMILLVWPAVCADAGTCSALWMIPGVLYSLVAMAVFANALAGP